MRTSGSPDAALCGSLQQCTRLRHRDSSRNALSSRANSLYFWSGLMRQSDIQASARWCEPWAIPTLEWGHQQESSALQWCCLFPSQCTPEISLNSLLHPSTVRWQPSQRHATPQSVPIATVGRCCRAAKAGSPRRLGRSGRQRPGGQLFVPGRLAGSPAQ